MFWSSLAAQSRINDLLDQPDLTIEELLNDDEVLQKCCERDQRLVDFLCRAENMDFMINVISNPPNSDDFDKSLYRYSSLVCEILTCIIPRVLDLIVGSTEGLSSSEKTEDGSQMEDTWNSSSMEVDDSVNKLTTKHPSAQNALSSSDMSIGDPTAAADSTVTGNESGKLEGTNSVLSNESKNVDSRPHLNRLLRAVQPDVGLNPLTASFLSRVLVHLAVNRSQIVIPYMRKFPNLLDNIVARLELTSMADLLIQLAQQEQCARTLFEWFVEDNLVPRLIDCFVPSNSWEVHESAAHCLIQLIVILRSYLVNSAHSGQNADPSSTDFGSGLPANNPYAILMSEDEASLAAATRLLDILESEETMSALLARLTENDQTTTSIVVNCIEVFVTVLDKRRPETGFALPDGGPISGMELEMWFGDNLCNPANLFRPTPISGSAAPLGPPASAAVPAAGGNASVLNSGGDSRSAPNGTDRPESIDKIRIARASVNLARACRSRLSQLHALLRHPHEQHYNRMNTTAGLLDPPLGRCRLSVAQFFALLAALPLHTGIQEAMVADGVIKTLMNLFEMYPLNTLLHQAVRDFIMALFTHARVIEKSAGSNQAGEKGKIAVGNDSIGPLQNFMSTSSAMTANMKPPATNVDSSTVPMEIDTSELKTTEQANSEPISTVLDEAFRTILRDHLITEWCLRLSPIPRDRSSSDPDADTAAVRESTRHPKPGYSGHLWQLANLIQDARTGPRGEWVNGLMQGLDSACLKSWDEFVQGDLATINREQTLDSFGSLNSGKISMFLALLASQQSQQPDDGNGPNADHFVLKLTNRVNNDLAAGNGDDDDEDDDNDDDDDGVVDDDDEEEDDSRAGKGSNAKTSIGKLFGIRRKKRGAESKSLPRFLQSSMWAGASEEVKPTSDNSRLESEAFHSIEPVNRNLVSSGRMGSILDPSKLSRIRGTSLDSDEDDDDSSFPNKLNLGRLGSKQTHSPGGGTKSDGKDNDGDDEEDDDDDDDDDEEENLRSPMVIRQQRSSAGKTASIIHFPKVVGGAGERGILSSLGSEVTSTAVKNLLNTPTASFLSTNVDSDPWASASPAQGPTTTSDSDGWACFDKAPTEPKQSAFGEVNQTAESWPSGIVNDGPSPVNGTSKTNAKSSSVNESASCPTPTPASVQSPAVVSGSLPKPASS